MSGAGDSIRVLHVDDEPDVAELAATFLEQEDDRFTVETASSANHGLDRLTEATFDCVVSDYDMPGMDGIEFLEAVRETDPDLPFILFTGKGSEDVASDAISAGVTDYLQKKPGTDQYELLANRITNAVSAHHTEHQLSEHRQRFRTLFERLSQPTAEVEYDDAGDPIVHRVNPAFERVFGYDAADIVGESLDAYIVPDDRTDEAARINEHVQSTGRIDATEVTRLTADGPREFLLQNAVYDGGSGGFAIYTDITDRNAHQRRLRRLIDSLPGMVYRCRNEPGWPLENVGGEVTALTGYDPSELEGRRELTEDQLTHPDDEQAVWAAVQDALDNREPFELTYRIHTKQGDTKWVWERGQGIYDDAGNVEAIEGFITDITEREHRTQTFKRLHTAVQSVMQADTVEAVAERGVEAAADILGLAANAIHLYDEEQAALVPVARTDASFDLIEDLPTFEEGEGIAWRVYENGEALAVGDVHDDPDIYNPDSPARSELFLPLGEYGVLIAGSDTPGSFDDDDIVVGELLADAITTALQQVTRTDELRAREQDLEQANTLLRTLFETLPVGVVILDAEGTITRANERAETVLGLTEAEVIGRTYDDPAWEIVDADGAAIPDADLPFARVLESGETVIDYEHGIRWPDGRERWLSINATPLWADSDAGDIEQVVAVVSDITEQREQAQALRQHNERLEQFASIVSHDLRNPLAVAEGRLELAREACDSEHLDDVAYALDRMGALIEDLLTLAREGERVSELEPVAVEELVEGCWRSVETGEATLVVENEQRIWADRSRLQQLFENLFGNAVEHGGKDVTVTVGVLDGGFYVADDGPGIGESDRDQIFEPGYSTATEGTGFGLAIVREIAQAHGWAVAVTDGPAGGARFEITGVETLSADD